MSRIRKDDGSLDWKKIGYRSRSVFAVILSLVVVVGGGYFVFTKAYDLYMDWRTAEDYIGEGKDDIVVTIPSGASLTDIGGILVDADVIRSIKAFNEAVKSEPDAKNIQAGNWALKTQLPAETAVAMLLDNNNRVANTVQIIEGLRKEKQWEQLSAKEGIPYDDFVAAAKDGEALGLPSWAGGDPEGFLFPDTYEIPDDPTAAEIMETQIAEFNRIAKGLDLEGKAKSMGYTPLEILTVASILQREVGPEYQPMVARVIYNRLEAGMKLQFDTTVLYAVDGDNIILTDEQLAVDSPYNTYLDKNAGKLPPGPIDSPGQAAIEAAMSPADGDYLYFVTVNLDTGETLFTADENEHLANVQKFQAWCQANQGKC